MKDQEWVIIWRLLIILLFTIPDLSPREAANFPVKRIWSLEEVLILQLIVFMLLVLLLHLLQGFVWPDLELHKYLSFHLFSSLEELIITIYYYNCNCRENIGIVCNANTNSTQFCHNFVTDVANVKVKSFAPSYFLTVFKFSSSRSWNNIVFTFLFFFSLQVLHVFQSSIYSACSNHHVLFLLVYLAVLLWEPPNTTKAWFVFLSFRICAFMWDHNLTHVADFSSVFLPRFMGVNPESLLSTEFAFISRNEKNSHFSLLCSVVILGIRT